MAFWTSRFWAGGDGERLVQRQHFHAAGAAAFAACSTCSASDGAGPADEDALYCCADAGWAVGEQERHRHRRRADGRHRLLPAEQPRRHIVEQRVDDRDDDQREQRRGDEAADDGAGHRRPELGALAEGEEQRQHAEDHRGRRHQDRAEPRPSRRDDRRPAVHAAPAEDLRVVDQQDGVLGDEAHQHDEADERHDVDRVAGEHECARHTDNRQGQREHDRQRVDERLELRRQDQVDEDDGEQEGFTEVAERLVHHLRVAALHDLVARRQRHP